MSTLLLNVVLDASLLSQHNPQPSQNARRPTLIDPSYGFLFGAHDGAVTLQDQQDHLALRAQVGAKLVWRIRCLSSSNQFALAYQIKLLDTGTPPSAPAAGKKLSVPVMSVQEHTVPVPDPAEPTRYSPGRQAVISWNSRVKALGTQPCQLLFYLVGTDESTQTLNTLGYYALPLTLTLDTPRATAV